MSRRPLVIALTVLTVIAPGVPTRACPVVILSLAEIDLPARLASLEAQMEEVELELLEAPADPELHGRRWSLIAQLGRVTYYRLLTEPGPGGSWPGERQLAAEREHWRGALVAAAEAWIAAAPEYGGGYFALRQLLPAAGDREVILRRWAEAAPHNVQAVLALAEHLAAQGEAPGAAELVERFLDDHPADPEVYMSVLYHFAFLGDGERVDALFARWLAAAGEAVEGEGQLLATYLDLRGENLDDRALAAVAGWLGGRPHPARLRLIGCEWLDRPSLRPAMLACYERLLEAEEEAAQEAFAALERLLIEEGDPARLAALRAEYPRLAPPGDSRLGAAGPATTAGGCRAALRLLDERAGGESAGAYGQTWAAVSRLCEEIDDPEGLQRQAASATPAALGRLVTIQSRTGALIRPVVEERLAAGGDPALYALAVSLLPDDAEPAELRRRLAAWAEAAPRSPFPMVRLAASLRAEGLREAALAAYGEALERSLPLSLKLGVVSNLLELAMEEGDPGPAARIVEGLLAAGLDEGSLPSQAHLALARVARAAGRLEQARRHYDKAFPSPVTTPGAPQREYLDFLLELGDRAAVERYAERGYVESGGDPGFTRREGSLGKLLLDYDLPGLALPHLEAAVTRGGEQAESFCLLAAARFALGDRERAQRALDQAAALDPAGTGEACRERLRGAPGRLDGEPPPVGAGHVRAAGMDHG